MPSKTNPVATPSKKPKVHVHKSCINDRWSVNANNTVYAYNPDDEYSPFQRLGSLLAVQNMVKVKEKKGDRTAISVCQFTVEDENRAEKNYYLQANKFCDFASHPINLKKYVVQQHLWEYYEDCDSKQIHRGTWLQQYIRNEVVESDDDTTDPRNLSADLNDQRKGPDVKEGEDPELTEEQNTEMENLFGANDVTTPSTRPGPTSPANLTSPSTASAEALLLTQPRAGTD